MVRDAADPQPSTGQVLLSVKGAGVCYHDVINRRGGFPRTKFPAILGHEIAGEVVEVGPGVTQFRTGDRVAAIQLQPCGACIPCLDGRESLCRSGHGFFGEEVPGGYAELVACDVSALVRLPEPIPFEVGSILACTSGTALHAIRARAKVSVGETLLVTGASGGVGSSAIQIAALAGARVIAVTSSPAKVAALNRLGASDIVVDKGSDFSPEVKEMTGGEGVDAVLEIVGAATFASSYRCVRPGGRLVFVGNVTEQQVSFPPAVSILKELSILGSDACSRSELLDVIDLVLQRRLAPVIDRTMSLEDAAESHRLLESRNAEGRIVLVP